jgi:hypothetical protein
MFHLEEEIIVSAASGGWVPTKTAQANYSPVGFPFYTTKIGTWVQGVGTHQGKNQFMAEYSPKQSKYALWTHKPQMTNVSKNTLSLDTLSLGHVHELLEGNTLMLQMLGIVVRSHHATPMFTTVSYYCPNNLNNLQQIHSLLPVHFLGVCRNFLHSKQKKNSLPTWPTYPYT